MTRDIKPLDECQHLRKRSECIECRVVDLERLLGEVKAEYEATGERMFEVMAERNAWRDRATAAEQALAEERGRVAFIQKMLKEWHPYSYRNDQWVCQECEVADGHSPGCGIGAALASPPPSGRYLDETTLAQVRQALKPLAKVKPSSVVVTPNDCRAARSALEKLS